MITQLDIATGEILALEDGHRDIPPEKTARTAPAVRLLTVDEAIETTQVESVLSADVAMLPIDQLLGRWR